MAKKDDKKGTAVKVGIFGALAVAISTLVAGFLANNKTRTTLEKEAKIVTKKASRQFKNIKKAATKKVRNASAAVKSAKKS